MIVFHTLLRLKSSGADRLALLRCSASIPVIGIRVS